VTYVALVGLTLVLVRSALFNRLRPKLTILACAQCTGWWVGLFGHRLLPGSLDYSYAGVRYADALVTAFAVSAIAFVVNAILTFLIGEVLTVDGDTPVGGEKK